MLLVDVYSDWIRNASALQTQFRQANLVSDGY